MKENHHMSQREEIIGHYRRSIFTGGFWWRFILTLGLYLYLWNRNKITLTNRRIIQRHGGIIGGEEVSLLLNRITDIKVKTSALGTIFRYGLFQVQSAGSDKAEINFSGLSRPHKLKEAIYDLQDGTLDGSPFDEGSASKSADEPPTDE
jgi:hypothetical protein